MRVKRLAQEHNTMTRPGLEPGPLDPESRVVTIRLSRPPELFARQLILILRLLLLFIAISYSCLLPYDHQGGSNNRTTEWLL